jgi:hypothetical protein
VLAGFFKGIPVGHEAGKRRAGHHETTVLVRLEENGIGVGLGLN